MLWYLVWFSCGAAILVPLWWSTMSVSKANIRIEYTVEESCGMGQLGQVVDVVDARGKLQWKDGDRVIDEFMRGKAEGIYVDDSVDDAGKEGNLLRGIVFGSMGHVWVRSREDIAFVKDVLDGKVAVNASELAPLSTRYTVTVTYFSPSNASKIESDHCLVAQIMDRLSPHISFRFATQRRYGVPARLQGSAHHWSSGSVLAGPLERSIHLVGDDTQAMLRQLKQKLGFPVYKRKDMVVVGLVPEWELKVWRGHFMRRLCESARATLKVLPVGVTLASDATPAADPRMAWEEIESAFFHPDALALLYFPPDHKIAVYLPVFFPAAFALLSVWFAFLRTKVVGRS